MGSDAVFIGRSNKAEIKRLFGQHISSSKVGFFEAAGLDFVPGRREGAFIWDVSGEKRLIDCHSNGGVYNLGHRHPAIREVLQQSIAELDIGNHLLLSEQRAYLAVRLAELAPGDLSHAVFGVSGGEAIDLAIKIARGYSGKQKIISAAGGYHGHTGLALFAGDAAFFEAFGPRAPGFEQVPFGDLEALEAAATPDTAAILLETVPATNGILVPDADYLPAVRRLCDQHDILLISDEVQTGLGRTGLLWGVDHFEVVPDILVLGKGLSGGLFPMTATVFRAELECVFHPDPFVHISTLGGAEVGVPVTMKVLELTADEQFLGRVRETAAFFTERFDGLCRRYPHFLVRLRQLGMMMGIEMREHYQGPLFSRVAFDNGLLVVYAGNDRRVAQFLPPLIIDRALAEEIMDRVERALQQMDAVIKGAMR